MGGGTPRKPDINWSLVATSLSKPAGTPSYMLLQSMEGKDNLIRQKLVKQLHLPEEARGCDIAEALSKKNAVRAPGCGLGDR